MKFILRFLRRPQNAVLVEKGDIEFECEVYSVPQSTIQWYKNGDLIIESEYFQASTNKIHLPNCLKRYWKQIIEFVSSTSLFPSSSPSHLLKFLQLR